MGKLKRMKEKIAKRFFDIVTNIKFIRYKFYYIALTLIVLAQISVYIYAYVINRPLTIVDIISGILLAITLILIIFLQLANLYILEKKLDSISDRMVKVIQERDVYKTVTDSQKIKIEEYEDMEKTSTQYLKSVEEDRDRQIRSMGSTIEQYEIDIAEYKTAIEEMIKLVEKLQKERDASNEIEFEDIYPLYQIYLLIRKYRITNYKIKINPVSCDVTIPMSVYTRISINNELISHVQYHIDGTNITLKGETR